MAAPLIAAKLSRWQQEHLVCYLTLSSNLLCKLVRRGASFQGADEEVLFESGSFPEEVGTQKSSVAHVLLASFGLHHIRYKENDCVASQLAPCNATCVTERISYLARSHTSTTESAQVAVGVPGADWHLFVYNPLVKQTRNTRDGLIALIVVAAFIVSGKRIKCLLAMTGSMRVRQRLPPLIIQWKKLGVHGVYFDLAYRSKQTFAIVLSPCPNTHKNGLFSLVKQTIYLKERGFCKLWHKEVVYTSPFVPVHIPDPNPHPIPPHRRSPASPSDQQQRSIASLAGASGEFDSLSIMCNLCPSPAYISKENFTGFVDLLMTWVTDHAFCQAKELARLQKHLNIQ
eukprot:1155863-Pelagomonas_calceolata.AAC.1